MLLFLNLFDHFLALVRILVAFERLLGLALQVVNELLHVGLERFAPTPADLQSLGPIGIDKIVDVAPILRRR